MKLIQLYMYIEIQQPTSKLNYSVNGDYTRNVGNKLARVTQSGRQIKLFNGWESGA